eukprot:6203628-Pleurochrysis_carterae.AAC.2
MEQLLAPALLLGEGLNILGLNQLALRIVVGVAADSTDSSLACFVLWFWVFICAVCLFSVWCMHTYSHQHANASRVRTDRACTEAAMPLWNA